MPPQLSATTLLAIVQPWSEIAEPILRRLTHVSDAGAGEEALWIGCGSGRSVLWWCDRFQKHTQGVDPDPDAIEVAERAGRRADLASLATFQVADPANLPHEDQVFDMVFVHVLHLPGADAQSVIDEAGRVVRPMCCVVALVPAWLKTPTRQDVSAMESLGISPRIPVEWKGVMRNAGLVELTVEDAGPDGSWIAHGILALLIRGWHAGGWVGARTVVEHPMRTLRRLVRNRFLGLFIMKGTRWPQN